MKNRIINSNRWVIAAGMVILFYLPYFLVNKIQSNHYRITFVRNEDHIPFLPWTVLVYISIFIQGYIVIHRAERTVLPSIIQVMGITVLVHILGFLSFPTEYPRECYPSSNLCLTIVRWTDTSANCTPSLHVATTLIFAACYQWGVPRASRFSKFFFWFWSLAIIASTLTTKQHYLWDIAAASIVTGTILYFSRKKLQPYE